MNDGFEAAFQALRREYIQESDARLAELRAAVAGIRLNQPEALASLQMLAHRLAGSGGSYDFPDITQAARALEQLLADPADPAELDAAVDRLAERFRAAAAELDG